MSKVKKSASGKSSASGLPLSLAVTFAVVVLPCLVALVLKFGDVVTSPVLLIILPVLISIAVSQGLAVYWKRREASTGVLFEDLMLWGWVRNRRFENLLARADEFVGPNANSNLSRAERAKKLEQLSAALDARDPYTHGHSRRVARHAETIARRMKLPKEEVARIRTAALLHDVGKIETPKEIIDKPGALSDEEYEVIKLHPGAGAKMVEELNDPELTAIVRHHHERIDGGGYPDGIAGEAIPLGARIIAVADTFDALTSARPYRPARAHEFAINILRKESGEQLDASAVEAFDSKYAGHRPVAIYAAVLGVGRQAGQSLIGIGSGASQVAAVGAAATVIGVTPVSDRSPDPVPAKEPSISRQASADGADATGISVAGTDGGGDSSSPNSKSKGGSDPKDKGSGGNAGDPDNTGNGGDGNNTGNGDGGNNGGNGGGSDGGSDGGGSSGGGSSGGGSPGGGGTTPSNPVQDVTSGVQDVVESVPVVPKEVPGSGAINNTVNGVKDVSGNLLKPK
jgi:putative nucleotidyltransferase with HDIG domain